MPVVSVSMFIATYFNVVGYYNEPEILMVESQIELRNQSEFLKTAAKVGYGFDFLQVSKHSDF